MQSVEPVLENAIKTLQKVVDVRGMGKKWAPWSYTIPWNLKDKVIDIYTLSRMLTQASQVCKDKTNVLIFLIYLS